MAGSRVSARAAIGWRKAAFTSAAAAALLLAPWPAQASTDLGNGFADLGVAAPISNHRGTVSTVDGAGRDVVLSYIMDRRGGYSLLMIDAATGKTEQFPIPFENTKMDSPYASILSSQNRFYTHFGDNFIEFDPAKKAFTFSHKTTPQMAMGMTEDDNGVIWSVSYPQSAVVSYNPKTGEFKDYGNVYKQNWPQYQRFVAADDAGWIYFALGMTATQIVAFDPQTSQAKPLLKEDQREKGMAYVYRDQNGKVYGQASHEDGKPWFEMYKGEIKPLTGEHKPNPKPIVTDSQVLMETDFPDGRKLQELNLVDRKLTTLDPATSKPVTVPIDYKSEGAMLMAMAAAPDGTITGGTAFPMRAFSYNPAKDEMTNRPAYGQWNTVATLGENYFVGGYPRGFMLEWAPGMPWVNTEKGNPNCNPKYLTEISPVVHRPHCLLPLADGNTVVMGGTPEYGYTGGGLLFWDRAAGKPTILKDSDLVPDQSAHAMVELPGGKLLIGTTTDAGTGGERKATEAVTYILDIATKKVSDKKALIPGAAEYTTFYRGENGLVYGFADAKTFFVYDPAKGEVVSREDVSSRLGRSTSPQGPRVFIPAGKRVFALMHNGIVELDLTTNKLGELVKSPVELECGGDFLNGRIYFGSGSHVYSWQVK